MFDFDIEDDPAAIARAMKAEDSYPAPDGWCAQHDDVWNHAKRRCETASTFKNAKHTCRQRDDIG